MAEVQIIDLNPKLSPDGTELLEIQEQSGGPGTSYYTPLSNLVGADGQDGSDGQDGATGSDGLDGKTVLSGAVWIVGKPYLDSRTRRPPRDSGRNW